MLTSFPSVEAKGNDLAVQVCDRDIVTGRDCGAEVDVIGLLGLGVDVEDEEVE